MHNVLQLMDVSLFTHEHVTVCIFGKLTPVYDYVRAHTYESERTYAGV